jgi:tetratricopeptide (TPR) repeat protein
MAVDSSNMLTEAIAAVRVGERARAREILSKLLRTDSQNAEYWVWMSSVVDSPRERKYCLESALRIDPTNRAALRGLVILGERTPTDRELSQALKIGRRQIEPLEEITPIKVEPEEEKQSPTIAITTDPARSPFKPQRRSVFSRVMLLVAVAVIGIGGIYALIRFVGPLWQTNYFGFASTLPAASPSATETPLPGTPTATPIPAATRIIRTPISTEFYATPLALLIPVTPTATPIAGYTPRPEIEAFSSGILALQRREYEQAIAFFDQALVIDPEFVGAVYFKGEAQRQNDLIGTSIGTFDEASKMDPEFPATYLGRGRALLERDEIAAEQDFQRAIERDPQFVEAYLELAEYYANKRLWQRLETILEQAIEDGAGSPLLYVYLSTAEINLAKYEKALAASLQGSADDPGLLEGYLAVGRAYVALAANTLEFSYFSSVIWPMETYITYAPEDPTGWAIYGRALVGTGDYDLAMQVLNTAIALDDRSALAYQARGILYTELGQYDLALQDLSDARRYGTVTFDLMISTARALYLQGEYQLALREYLNPVVTEANNIASSFIKERKLAEAYALRGLIYESNPDNINDAIRQWSWILDFENALPETKALAQQHYDELTGVGPTRTPTASPTPTTESTFTPTATPTPTVSQTP